MADTSRIRSKCVGRETLSTKVDAETRRWIDARAEDAGVTPTEYLRRILDLYRSSAESDLSCPSCGTYLDLSHGVES